ncbi:MAG TPA: hypothetical protein VFJ51_12205 [Nitrososphaeraceae archaeon]|nr:hypothetical protein [Nitrososphaeraceae archaeon]
MASSMQFNFGLLTDSVRRTAAIIIIAASKHILDIIAIDVPT